MNFVFAVRGGVSSMRVLQTKSLQLPSLYHNVQPAATFARSYSKFGVLPRYPVPSLRSTVDHFVKFARPLQDEHTHAVTTQLAKEFLHGGEGERLQSLLEERAASMRNWLTPWWLNIAYLASRSPLPIVTSPGLLFPKWNYEGPDGQVDAAAKIIQAALRFHFKILNEDLPSEKIGDALLDMSQYRFLFGTTRIPKLSSDVIRYGCDISPPSKHILVMRNGHMFKMPVLDPVGNMAGLEQLRRSLKDVVLPQSDTPNKEPVGIVSSDNRDVWARVYSALNERNAGSIAAIEESLFVVCLDKKMRDEEGLSPVDIQALQCLHGGGSHNNSTNRWFDKTLQFIIGTDGYCGVTYEHTPAEGPPVAALMDFICHQMKENRFDEKPTNGPIEPTSILKFFMSDSERSAIESAKTKMNAAAKDTDLRIYKFSGFGKERVKKWKVSPDSFIQLALQLAYYRIHGRPGPAYETATLRKFDEGRTDTIRLPNAASATFASLMSDSKENNSISNLALALRLAAHDHKHYASLAMNGKGMDRHLLGLRLIAKENGLQIPKIFLSDAYQKLMHFTLSTSQVPTKHFIPLCFGPSADDCYGICYNPQRDAILFSICTSKSCNETDSARFAKELERAFLDMESVLENAEAEKPRSKL